MVFVLSLITAFLILMRNPKEASNRNAFYFILLVALWTADVFAQWTVHNLELNMFFAKISYMADFIILFFLYFAYNFTKTEIALKKKLLLAIPFLIAFMIPFFFNIFSYFNEENCDYILEPAILYLTFAIDIVYAFMATRILVKYYKNPMTLVFNKHQAPVLIGALWFFIFWNIFHEFLAIGSFNLGNYIENTPHFIVGNLAFVSLIAFAIIKRDLFRFNTVFTIIFSIIIWTLLFLGLFLFPISLGNIIMFAVFYAILMLIFWKM